MDEASLLDWGSRIGVAALNDEKKVRSEVDVLNDERRGDKKVDLKSQLENLKASLDSVTGREALLATAAYAIRQAQRLKKGYNMANLVKRALIELYEKGADKEHARKMLDFAKWVYEANLQYGGNYEDLTLLKLLKQQRRR